MCDGVDDCPMGEDENSEDWFSSEEVVAGSFSKEFVHEQLRLWGEHYLKSSNISATLEETMKSTCVKTDSNIFLLYTILACTAVGLIISLPAACLVRFYFFFHVPIQYKMFAGSKEERLYNDAQII